jgi:hypothetical protein
MIKRTVKGSLKLNSRGNLGSKKENMSEKEVKNLAIKQMPLEEKYEKLLDAYLLNSATLYALHKKLGIVDKCIESLVKTEKNRIPSFSAGIYKLLKTVAPGTAFNQLMDQEIYEMQATMPLSNIEVNRVSSREVTMRIKGCPILKRTGELIKKTGLDVDPKELCEIEPKVMSGVAKDFGIDMSWRPEENGCSWTVKLK